MIMETQARFADPSAAAWVRRMPLPAPARPFSLWWVWCGGAALWWTANGLISAAQMHAMRAATGQATAWVEVLRIALANSYMWVPVTIFALWSAAYVPIGRRNVAAPLLFHMTTAVVLTAGRLGGVVLLNPLVGWYETLPPITELSVTGLSNNLLIYLLLVGVGHALYYWRAARQQEGLVWEAQLRALKSQLQPHFLFNTLNTISSSVRSDPAVAERMIEDLGRLLRHSLEGNESQEVSLDAELVALEPYLDIELTRFEDRLTIRRHIEPGVLDAAIPHFMLQPIVENAVRHGIAPRASPGSIDISVTREDDDIVIQVQNDGVAIAPDYSEQAWGIGLSNTRDRLQRLYGSRHRIELSAASDGAVRTVVRIPYRSMRA